MQATQPRVRFEAPAEERPVCLRCSLPEDELLHYCMHCGAPVGAYTLCLPFERIRSYGDFLVRCLRVTLRGNGCSWLAGLLGVAGVLIVFPIFIPLVVFCRLGRRDTGPRDAGTRAES